MRQSSPLLSIDPNSSPQQQLQQETAQADNSQGSPNQIVGGNNNKMMKFDTTSSSPSNRHQETLKRQVELVRSCDLLASQAEGRSQLPPPPVARRLECSQEVAEAEELRHDNFRCPVEMVAETSNNRGGDAGAIMINDQLSKFKQLPNLMVQADCGREQQQQDNSNKIFISGSRCRKRILTSCQPDRINKTEFITINKTCISSPLPENYAICSSSSSSTSQPLGGENNNNHHHHHQNFPLSTHPQNHNHTNRAAIKQSINLMALLPVRTLGKLLASAEARKRLQLPAKSANPANSVALSSTMMMLVVSSSILLMLLMPDAACKLASAATANGAASGQQYFDIQPEAEYLVMSGQDARLRCLIRNRQGDCVWLRNGRAIGSISKKYQFDKTPPDGDCSLSIKNVTVQFDDAKWQCQVTAPDVDQDTLQSRESSLTVLVAPERPQIKNMSQNTHRLIMEENKTKFVLCEIRGGNPAPQIEWLLDNKNITKDAQASSFSSQQQQQQQQQPNQRITQSKLKMSDIKRNMNGKNLTCVGVHPTINQSTSAELDVQYLPTVSVHQREYSIVEGSPLSISCQVDSNPPPNLVNWRLVSDGLGPPGAPRSQQQSPSSSSAITQPTRPGPVLEFERISRDLNQNVFECLAQNSYGISMPADVKLNVLYAPFLLNTSHSGSVDVGSEAQLACIFDGNPEPEVKWLYTDPLSRSNLPVQLENSKQQQYLNIKNVTYRNEGDYHCEARNQINGVFYGVRSSNILLDVFGEPQFLVKSPVHSKAIQGSKSDLVLAFCSDPAPHKVYWQFGSLRLDVRLNNINNGQQPTGGAQAPAAGANSNKQQSSVMQRFQVHPLQPLQKRDSAFSKTPTCFEAQLSILDPELTDQRDYTLVVQNERGHQSSVVRLRVSSPLSPVLMITSAFVTICGLFLCSLIVMFLVKKRHHGHQSSSNGLSNGGSQNGGGGGGQVLREKGGVEHLVNGNGNGAAAAALASAAAVSAQLMQQQTRGVVNGVGNGVANGASNPAAQSPKVKGHMQQQHHHHHHHHQQQHQLDPNGSNGRLHLMSMAASDTSGDQKQLLANLDRNSSASLGSTNNACVDYEASSPAGSSGGRSAAHTIASQSSTPSPMNHVSVDDDDSGNCGAGSTYRAAESVQPLDSQQLGTVNGNGLIYANLDYTDHHSMALSSVHSDNGSQTTAVKQQQPQEPEETSNNNNNNNKTNHHHNSHLHQHQQRQSALQRRQQTPMEHSPTGSSLTEQSIASILASNNNTGDQQQQQQPSRRPGSPPGGIRSSVGATIAMMNSLAAAANQNNTGNSPNSVGALSHQLANSRQLRKPGPPKPPKPSIQQRNRFYQQQQQGSGINNNTGLVMIGQTGLNGYTNPMGTIDPNEPSANELAVEYSRIAFPARAEL